MESPVAYPPPDFLEREGESLEEQDQRDASMVKDVRVEDPALRPRFRKDKRQQHGEPEAQDESMPAERRNDLVLQRPSVCQSRPLEAPANRSRQGGGSFPFGTQVPP